MLFSGASETAVPPLLLLLVALGLDAVIGGRPGILAVLPHPVRVIGGLIDRIDRALNREDGNARRHRALGLLTVMVVCGLSGAVGWAVGALSHTFPAAAILELGLVVSLLTQRSLYVHVRAVASALNSGGLVAGRRAVGHIVGRNVESLDEAGVARAAIESCAENFSDGVVAPVFWYAALGLPGLLVYKAANTLDSMIGNESARYRDFGRAAARLDDLFNLAPARVSGLLIVGAAAIVSPARARLAWTTMSRDARLHRSPNAGWPEAAAAGALGLRLGGPRSYGATPRDEPWLGAGSALATSEDIARMLRLYVLACCLNAGIIAVIAAIGVGAR
jgi:adenosylcobinamide-phosphate synthase